MKYKFICLIALLAFSFSGALDPLPVDFIDKNSTAKKGNENYKKGQKSKKSFNDLIKDYSEISGLFTFYHKEDKNKCYIAITPEQLNEIYLLSLTRQSGDGWQFDGSSMLGEFPFYFNKMGERIQLIRKNTKFRADADSAISRVLNSHVPNSIISSGKIESSPHPETGAILVDAKNFFIYDISNVANRTEGKYRLDKDNSSYNYINSYPMNSEIDVLINFSSSKPQNRFTLASSKSMLHRYHISISALPKSEYQPRIADDRVGHFTTIYQDYSDTFVEDPYTRYVQRWNLKKENPKSKMSKPVKPIVFWIENTVPLQFRNAVRDGILAWNEAFEAIGFKDAIVAKQMPDDADWDPADVRYSTIRWMIHPESAYAVGPSRANPFTGELYDADIRLSNDYVRFYYTDYINLIEKLGLELDSENINWDNHKENHNHSEEDCKYGEHLKQKMSFTWNYLISSEKIKGDAKDLEDFVNDGIVDLVLHEVGHTLGLRHNFKSSSVFTFDQLSHSEFTDKYGVTGSVMDYNATNLLDGGVNYFQTKPGIYDYWAIEYAYSELPYNSNLSEDEWLQEILSKSTQPWLAYATDEDSYGTSIDPLTSRRDMTSEPIKFYQHQLNLAQDYWDNLLNNFEKDGDRYPKIRNMFYEGLWEFYGASRNVSKFIGGIYHSRHHIGQYENYETPLKVVESKKQRNALYFLIDNILDKDAFSFSPNLLNKLAPERNEDFTGTVWRMKRIDFPIHSVITQLQKSTLTRLYNPARINRMHDNMLKYDEPIDKFGYNELFGILVNELWSEVGNKESINSFRRELQSYHIKILTNIYFDEYNMFPEDASSLALNNLVDIFMLIKDSLGHYTFLDDNFTEAHLNKIYKDIDSVMNAKLLVK